MHPPPPLPRLPFNCFVIIAMIISLPSSFIFSPEFTDTPAFISGFSILPFSLSYSFLLWLKLIKKKEYYVGKDIPDSSK